MISIINFSHSDPLYLGFSNKEHVLRNNPFENLKLVLDGKVDASMVSLLSYLENSNDLILLKTATIHSTRKTISTILISRKPGMDRKIRVAITKNTRTTEFYLSLVLERLGIDYTFVRTDKTEAEDLLAIEDYALLNGDEALRVYSKKYPLIADVGNMFSKLYGMEPVYAVTVSREPFDYSAIDEAILSSYSYKDECSMALSSRLGIPLSVASDYYSVIRYEYGIEVERTINFVRSLITASNGKARIRND
ncbi:hypothetical protein [Thermoplasma volcanium GSS1]|uniref:Uncharacterized protein n=1 Tax=Thermoplasma volcanium (strain ATCC 51530 / DSM 4299 / JCM 9571 / NBRC 15438 / GSS1) TaxID=273116 RepID=Q978L3_THEVO|nr:menaquinone biosynthetic enzyme MqnA/MqnD family protein [Thermoplasma volcanium]BAB60544.1 hypothetical protein [Thermoplasma volcanium GSS1]